MIRDIQDSDIHALTDIYNWYIQNTEISFETRPLTYEEFGKRAQEIHRNYPYIVLEEDGKILGYAYLNHFNTRSSYDWTADLSIYLDKNARGKGYGSRLMQAILDIAEKDGYVNVISIVTSGNQASEHIHEKFGFERLCVFKNSGYKHGKWLSVTYFMKRLNAPVEQPVHPSNIPYRQK